MGDWDYYCALCGGPLAKPEWDMMDPDEMAALIATEQAHNGNSNGQSNDGVREIVQYHDGYDPRVLPSLDDEKLDWLTKFKVVSETPEEYHEEVKRAWLSGAARVIEGIKANVSFPETHGPFLGMAKNISVYEGWSGPLTIPFHDHCHHLFLKYMDEEVLDLGAFYNTLRGLCSDGPALEINYGGIDQDMGQYWDPQWGREWIVMSPTDVPELRAYYSSMPKLVTDKPQESMALPVVATSDDPFKLLPPETMEGIMVELPMSSVKNLRIASRVAHNTKLSNTFWRERVQRDMRFLFDIPISSQTGGTTDWRRVYMDILDLSRPDKSGFIRGLANRVRIWERVFPQIAKPFREKQALAKREGL